MFDPQRTGLADWLATIDIPATIALIIGAVVALVGADVLARRLTMRAAARARIRARQWGAQRAANARRRARVKARTRAVARSFMDTPAARRFILVTLAVTAVAATVLSAHGVQDALTGAGLTAWWARVAGLVAFEGFLLVMASLSWWHRTTGQDGADVYGSLVWGGAGVLALVGYHGGGDWIYAVFAPMAALGFHLLTGAERRRRGAGTTWAARLGAAVRSRVERVAEWFGYTPTSESSSERDAERRYSRVVARRVAAERARRAKGWRVKLFERALAEAEARGLLDEAGRALIAERVAARYTAFDALAPSALAEGPALWRRGAAPAPMPEPEPVAPAAPAPAVVDEAPEPTPAPTVPEPVAPPAPVIPIRGADAGSVRELIMSVFPPKAKAGAAKWCADYFGEHGRLPTGRELGDAIGTHQGNARKWLAPVREALAGAAAA